MKQLFTILALFIGILSVNAQYIYNDFDANQNEVVSGWPNGATLVANPDASGINTSANVGEWVRTAEQWAHMAIELDGKIDFSTGTTFELKGHFPIACQTLLKLESTEGGGFIELPMDVTATGEWVQLTYDFPDGESGIYDKIVIFFDFASTADNIFYIDDIVGPEYTTGPPPVLIDLPITFDDDELNYGLIDFGGTASEIIVDADNENNKVVKTIRSETCETWAGTTVGGTNGFANPIPFQEDATSMQVSVWSPAAGIPVRMKVENADDAGISVETETLTTVAEQWEVMVFNFANEVEGTAALNLENTYSNSIMFFNFGTPGADAGEQIYYWDNIEFVDEGTSINELNSIEFDIYPNPANDYINLPFEGSNVKIYSMNGQVVLEAGSTGTMINITDLSSGVYFINATNQKGENHHSKFMKK